MDTITRPALGSFAKLGDLYDVRRDNFPGGKIFRQEFTGEVSTGDIPGSDTKFITSDKISAKFEHLDVSTELKLSVLGGLVTLEGSGKYLKEEKSHARDVSCSLMQKITTVYEELKVYDTLKENISLTAIQNGGATHFVSGIYWGANVVATATYRNEKNEDKREIEGNIKARFNKIPKVSAGGSAGVRSVVLGSKNTENFSIQVLGDVLPQEKMPETIEEAKNLIATLPELIKKANNGKGRPITYVLYPLTFLKDQLNVEVQIDNTIVKLGEETVLRVVQFFDDIQNAKQILNDIHDDVVHHSFCLHPETVQAIKDVKLNSSVSEAKIRADFAALLNHVKHNIGGKTFADIDRLIADFKKTEYSPANVLSLADFYYATAKEKIETHEALNRHEVSFLSKHETSLSVSLLNNSDRDIYFLFSDCKVKEESKDRWLEMIHLFLSIIKSGQSASTPPKFIYVDTDICPRLAIPGGIGIQHFRNGKCVSPDVYADHQRVANFCVAFSPETTYGAKLPEKTTDVEMRCPGSLGGGHCGNKVQKWSCQKCKEVLKFGFDDKFYCICGSAQARMYEFKCNDGQHGLGFLKFENEEVLEKLLKTFVIIEEKNILILGETGAGKSTWINGIANYLRYTTFDEAMKNEFHSPIPFSYTAKDNNGMDVTCKTGTDRNERFGNLEAGKSVTQYPKSHVFKRGDKQYRLIDTPGFSNFLDLNENYRRIIEYISGLVELHAIVILVHPDSLNFSFYVKWLFARLHVNSKVNICVCFTHGRKHGYFPDDAYGTLLKILKEANFEAIHFFNFVMDNEFVRLLARLKINSDNQALDEEYLNCNSSWTKSAKETNKFFDHISDLNPCSTKDIVGIHTALCELKVAAKMILEANKQAYDYFAISKELRLKFDNIPPVQLIDAQRLASIRMVCTAPKCVKDKSCNGLTLKTVCDNGCQDDIPDTGEAHNPETNNSDEMNNCTTCRCSFEIHDMAFTSSTEEVLPQVVDVLRLEEVSEFTKKVEPFEKEALKLNDKITCLKEMRNENVHKIKQLIEMLNRDAIAPYDGHVEEYLDVLIAREEETIGLDRSAGVLKALREIKSLNLNVNELAKLCEAADEIFDSVDV